MKQLPLSILPLLSRSGHTPKKIRHYSFLPSTNLIAKLIFCLSLGWPCAQADFQRHVSQFQQQMLFEAPLVSDFLAHVQNAYLSSHAAFTPIGAINPDAPDALAKRLPQTSSIKNIYAQITPSNHDRYVGNITVTVTFKNLRESPHTTAFFADSSIVFTALGSLGSPLEIPLDSRVKIPIEHEIVGFSCTKVVQNNQAIFASFSSESHTIDLSSQLSYPFNICST
jgi:hypothetical protein